MDPDPLKMSDKELLMLHWRSFSWCGSEHAGISLAYTGRQYCMHDSLQLFTTQISKDATPKIVETSLTIIFIMGQGLCHFLFVLQRQPILHSWQHATVDNSDYRWCKTNNRWRFLDGHLKVLCSQNLRTVRSVFIIMSASELRLGLISQRPHSNAWPSDSLSWIALSIWQFIYPDEFGILPAVLYSIDKYLPATADYSP